TGAGAVLVRRAARAAGVVEVEVDSRISVDLRVDPAGAGLALRTCRCLCLPVDGEVPRGVAAMLAFLTCAGDRERTDQLDPRARGLHDQFGAHVAGVDQVLGRASAGGEQ